MTIEGTIAVRLGWDGRRVRDVRIRSTRPFAVRTLLVGRRSAEGASVVPLLYSVCARAQAAASAAAIEAAEGRAASPAAMAPRAHAVVLETIEEYLRRFLVDWPDAMGHSRQVEAVALARRRIGAAGDDGRAELARELTAIAEQNIYGEPAGPWLDRLGAAALEQWARRSATLPALLLRELLAAAPTLGASDSALMPAPHRDALRAVVLPALRERADFDRAPLWEGLPVETGALARMHAHPALQPIRARWGNTVPTRMAARLAELALLLRTLAARSEDDTSWVEGWVEGWVEAFAAAPGEGVAAVQTARGLLLHRACVCDGAIADYQIVAPTEWNFHPDGPAARGLARLAANDETTLVRHARLAVQALDPCVAFDVEVAHA